MLRRIWFLSWGLLAFSTGAWGIAEFHLGGPAGNSWEGILAQEEGVYLVLDEAGNLVETAPFLTVVEGVHRDPHLATAGVDTMINYADNALSPAWIDPEENLALATSLAKRGGHFLTSSYTGGNFLRQDSKPLQFMIDGDPETAMLVPVEVSPRILGYNRSNVRNNVLNLGAELPINRILFYPRSGFEDNYLEWYEIGVAGYSAPFTDSIEGRYISRPKQTFYKVIDAALNSTNDPYLDILERNVENLDVTVDRRFPTRDLKWIALRPINPERIWEVAELEVYGEGFITRTIYRTGILDFGQAVAWSKIRWDGQLPPGTRVQMRTRTGNTPQPYEFLKAGRTGNLEKMSVVDYMGDYNYGRSHQVRAVYDVDNWSFWSTPYEFEAGLRDPSTPAADWADGTPLLSPSPARYFQFEIVLIAARDRAPRIDQLSLLFAEEPAAQTVIGEVWPIETTSFEPQTFTYVVLPVLQAGDRGFDRLEIFTQIAADSVHSVKVDGEEMIDRFEPQIESDRIVVGFEPLQAPRDNKKRIEVEFASRVIRFGGEFSGWVYDSGQPTLKQQIRPGNATYRFGGNILTVRTPIGGNLISRVQVVPSIFTPNRDGVNDRVRVLYDLRDLGAPRQFTFKIFDLTGRVVREVAGAPARSGSFVHEWDGRDAAGGLVAPGVYLYQLDLETDKGREVASGTLVVAY